MCVSGATSYDFSERTKCNQFLPHMLQLATTLHACARYSHYLSLFEFIQPYYRMYQIWSFSYTHCVYDVKSAISLLWVLTYPS